MLRATLLRCCVLSLAFVSCSTLRSTGSAVADAIKGPPVNVAEAHDVETRLFLIGDAGVPLVKDPVLASLTREVVAEPRRAVVVFLGDNVYPRGLPAEDSPARKEAERRLDAQLAVVKAARGARGIFIPGNHDWDNMGARGLQAILRQGEYIRQKGGEQVALLPANGCPGPVVEDIETKLRLVLLDTQWWLQPGEKPKGPQSPCPQRSEAEVLDALARALREANGRRVVVAGHHPLASGGSHGGYFSWRDHIFPLRARKSWLWIPLPGIGSAYPLSRQRGWSDQDLSGTLNRKMREALSAAFEKEPPIAYVAGHEHSLQVIEGKKPKYLLVSGTGAYGHVTKTAWTQQTLFARAASGYMRMDVEKSGRVRLAVVSVGGQGKATEEIAFDLTAEPESQKPTAAPPPGSVEKPPADSPKEQKPGVPETQPPPTKPPETRSPEGEEKPKAPPEKGPVQEAPASWGGP